MGSFVVYAKLTQREASRAYTGITKWFQNNPDRDTCQTETFRVRRNHVREDILKAAADGVVLKEKTTKKPAKKVAAKKSSAKKTSSTKKRSK